MGRNTYKATFNDEPLPTGMKHNLWKVLGMSCADRTRSVHS